MKYHKWAKYKIIIESSIWGKVLYASKLETAQAMAKYYNGKVVEL